MSEGTPALNEALAKVQSELPFIAKGEKADVPGKDGKRGYSYTYADLAGCSQAILPLLGRHGLSFTAKPTLVGGQFALVYALRHSSGESDEGVYPLPASGTPQAIGSAITYARRYCLCAVTGIAPADDDDGAAASAQDQHYDRRPSASEAFENATPAPGNRRREQQEQQPRRPGAVLAPLEDDAWETAIAGITSRDEGLKLYDEVAEMKERGSIDEQRAKLIGDHIAAKVKSLGLAEPRRQPAPQEPGYGLLANDPWLPKVRVIADGKDADAALADVQKAMNSGKLSKRGGGEVIMAIAQRKAELADAAKADAA